jgi:hypothetical protein
MCFVKACKSGTVFPGLHPEGGQSSIKESLYYPIANNASDLLDNGRSFLHDCHKQLIIELNT